MDKQVGAADPELQNSPIIDEGDEEAMLIKQEVPGEPHCYFNAQSYANGDTVVSGNAVLKCDYGVWIRQSGGADADNP